MASVDPAKDLRLQSFIAALKNARKGDEVLGVLALHGDVEQRYRQMSHNVELAPLSDYDLDLLAPLIAKKVKEGVKVALVDFSCGSGFSQGLAKTGACIVTQSAQGSTAYSIGAENTFSRAFLRGLGQAGNVPTNLQELFLQARSSPSDDQNLPQISSIPSPLFNGLSSLLCHTKEKGHQLDLIPSRSEAESLNVSLSCPTSTLFPGFDLFAGLKRGVDEVASDAIREELRAKVGEYQETYEKFYPLVGKFRDLYAFADRGEKLPDTPEYNEKFDQLAREYARAALKLNNLGDQIMRLEKEAYNAHYAKSDAKKPGKPNPCSSFRLL